jgi:hypothetical protein
MTCMLTYNNNNSADVVVREHENLSSSHLLSLQMVWASTYLVGCDVAACRRQKAATYLYVCHYCHEYVMPVYYSF